MGPLHQSNAVLRAFRSSGKLADMCMQRTLRVQEAQQTARSLRCTAPCRGIGPHPKVAGMCWHHTLRVEMQSG